MNWLDDKALPKSNKLFGWYIALTVDEFRRISSPIPMVNVPNSILMGIGAGSSIATNSFNGRPLLSALPRTLFAGAVGLWAGYYVARAYHQQYLGKFKYCFEYALSRKDDFPMGSKTKFSDPEVLYHFQTAFIRQKE